MNQQPITACDPPCARVDAQIETLKKLCGDPPARRVHLWLRALEKEDLQSIASLRRADPDAERRVLELIDTERERAPSEVKSDRRLFYGWMQDQHFERYGMLDAVFCSCARCLDEDAAKRAREDGG